MRVISGSAKGHHLRSVQGRGTRPTADRVKEAMFSALGSYFNGEQVLDLYAGTGALGIEALSRGCGYAVFVDKERNSIDVVKENLQKTGFAEQAKCLKMPAERAVNYLSKQDISFDMLFLDPPYRLVHMDALLKEIINKSLLKPGAVVVIEHDKAFDYPAKVEELILTKKAFYGSTALSFYSYEVEEM